MKHLISLKDWSADDIRGVLALAADIKKKHKAGELTHLLQDKTLVMLFQKNSTRTRLSFEAGMTRLGGHAIYLAPSDIKLGARS